MTHQERFLVFIPAYQCEGQVGRVLAQLAAVPAELDVRILVLDNCSKDGTAAAATTAAEKLAIPVTVGRNVENLGLGGSHKAAFLHAIRAGYDYVVVLHGDDQGAIADLFPHLARGDHRDVDALLGARFMRGARLDGYSALRTFGNRVFNLVFSAAAGQRLHDLGSGLNLYRVASLAKADWQGFADDLTFNYYLVLASAAWRWRMRFVPISWREADQTSNVRLFRQARRMVGIVARYVLGRRAFLGERHAPANRLYAFDVVSTNAAARACSEAAG